MQHIFSKVIQVNTFKSIFCVVNTKLHGNPCQVTSLLHKNSLVPSRFSRVRLTLCDPIDSSPPGSPVPGILQARTLEWLPFKSLLFPTDFTLSFCHFFSQCTGIFIRIRNKRQMEQFSKKCIKAFVHFRSVKS